MNVVIALGASAMACAQAVFIAHFIQIQDWGWAAFNAVMLLLSVSTIISVARRAK